MTSEPEYKSLRRLFLATDLSARCDRALDRAAMLAAETSAQLTVVHAFEPDVYAMTQDPRPAPSWRQRPDLKHAIALKQLHRELGQLDIPFELILDEGDPADVILRTANDHTGDLIVTGIARNETFGRFLFGGTVERLVRSGSVPVLVVKNRPLGPYRDIVVATDFSPASRKAIDTTQRMFPEARITLLHCYEGTASALVRPAEAGHISHEISQGEYDRFINSDAEAAERLAKLPIFIEQGSLDCVIHAYAADKNLDLVVIGSQKKNALTRALVGSVAETAMASAPADVLVTS